MRRISRALVGGALLATFATSASAGVKVFVGVNGVGDFHVVNNWSPSGIPTSQDRIVIPDLADCTITQNATVDTVEIEGGGTLRVNSDIKLTLNNSTNNIGGFPDDSVVDGLLRLGAGPVRSTLFFANTHTVTGVGAVEFVKDGALQIQRDHVVVNQLANASGGIRGSFTVVPIGDPDDPPPWFVNEGRVVSLEQVTFEEEVDLADSGGAIWLTDLCAIMTFRYPASLIGYIISEDSGALAFDRSVITCGTYIRKGGGLTVAANETFSYVWFIAPSSGTCPNPGTGGGYTLDCSQPWVAVGAHNACVDCP